MLTEPSKAEAPKRKCRWFSLTRDQFLLGMLAIEVFILLSDTFRWFGFENQTRTALIAIGIVALAMLVWFIRLVMIPLLRGHRWFQFSLRSLMIFTLICAIASAWVAHRMDQKRKERETVAAIFKLGGTVTYDYQIDALGEWIPNAEPPGPEWLTHLLGENLFSEVEGVQFYHKEMTADGLKNLKSLANLKSLSLRGSKINDSGLENLKALTRLRRLDLLDSNVTDAGLAPIKGLDRLHKLNLARTNVTDDAVNDLQKVLPNCIINH